MIYLLWLLPIAWMIIGWIWTFKYELKQSSISLLDLLFMILGTAILSPLVAVIHFLDSKEIHFK